MKRVLEHFEELPRRELLDALAHAYHALQTEHAGAPPDSRVRHRLEDRLLEVRERFERTLDEWVPDEELRAAWRAYLEHHAPEPDGPAAIRPLVFRGRSEAGSEVVIRRGRGEELTVEIDGSLAERIAGERDFAVTSPKHRFRLDGTSFEEVFEVSAETLDTLADAVAAGSSPPWEHAAELMSNGLIDANVALTPRGHRALARRTRLGSDRWAATSS